MYILLIHKSGEEPSLNISNKSLEELAEHFNPIFNPLEDGHCSLYEDDVCVYSVDQIDDSGQLKMVAYMANLYNYENSMYIAQLVKPISDVKDDYIVIPTINQIAQG